MLGIGIDIAAVARMGDVLGRHGDRFLERCFRPSEFGLPAGWAHPRPAPQAVAARWAAKEAFLKALGTDVRGVPYRDIEVVRSARGPVRLVLHGRAAEALAAVKGGRIHLSFSHERDYAVATVLIEK